MRSIWYKGAIINSLTFSMYQFPYITTIDPILKAIENADEFVVKNDPSSGIIIVNYIFASDKTFPDPLSIEDEKEALYAALRRECRGIEFDIDTGEIVTRKYHKFFNCNQLPETQIDKIDWSLPHVVYSKLDGSLITAMIHKKGHIEWHTKMGNTQVARPIYEFVQNSRVNYEQFARDCDDQNLTPMWEWCSRQQRIVLDYPTENLTLTAIRHKNTGEYLSYSQMWTMAEPYHMPVVPMVGEITEINGFLSDARQLEGQEGYVIRFNNGHALKIKSDWYCAIHNTKELLTREKSVWALIVEDRLDDAKPLMPLEERQIVEAFAEEFDKRLVEFANRLTKTVEKYKTEFNNDKKRFVLEYVQAHNVPSIERGLLLTIWDGKDTREVVLNLLKKNVSTQTKVDEVRVLLNNIKWSDYYKSNMAE